MKAYAVIIPLYTKILVKDVESADEAIQCAKDKALLNIKYVSVDESIDIDVFDACNETKFHLISQP